MDKQMNINDLRAVLSEEIQKIREGLTTAANVNAITNATGKILSTIKMQMEYCKLTGKTPELDVFVIPDHQGKLEIKKK